MVDIFLTNSDGSHPTIEPVPIAPLTDEELRVEAVNAAATLMGPLTTKAYVTTAQLFQLSDEIANYIRTGKYDDNTQV